MDPLRIVALGVDHPHGEMYRTTLAHHRGIELVGAFDADPERAMAMLESERVDVPVSGDMENILKVTEPDAVLIALPNDVTPHAIEVAATSGLHMFAEKPSAVSAAAFLPAHEAVLKADVRFLSGYLRRFSPVATTLRSVIGDGILGELVAAQVFSATTTVALRNSTYLGGKSIESVATSGTSPEGGWLEGRHWLFDRKRSGGGIMHWLGVHWIDLLRFVTGHEFTHAEATLATRTSAPVDVEDVASVTLESASGLLATLSCAYVLPRGPDQSSVSIQGTLGWATWDGVGPDLRVQSSHPSWRPAPDRSFHFQVHDMPGYSGALGWEAFERFRVAALGGDDLPMDVTDALRILEVLDAIHLSSGREGQRVAVQNL